MCILNRCKREIPELAPFLSWYGAQIGSLWVPIIKILIIVPKLRMVTCIYCSLSVKINTHKTPTARQDCRHIVLILFLHRVIYEVWDLLYISVTFSDCLLFKGWMHPKPKISMFCALSQNCHFLNKCKSILKQIVWELKTGISIIVA